MEVLNCGRVFGSGRLAITVFAAKTQSTTTNRGSRIFSKSLIGCFGVTVSDRHSIEVSESPCREISSLHRAEYLSVREQMVDGYVSRDWTTQPHGKPISPNQNCSGQMCKKFET